MTAITTCVFDAYGTLFDVHSAVALHAHRVGPAADEMSRLWRARQTEYSWTLSLMGRHTDFWTLTERALDYAMAVHGVHDAALRDDLLHAYLELAAYADVPPALRALREAGVRTGILTNGTPDMVRSAIRASGIEPLLDFALSVEQAGIFKPDRRVYQLVLDECGVQPGEVAFQSSNAWDAAGAAAFGFQVSWINRTGLPPEYPLGDPMAVLRGLDELPRRVLAA